MSPGAVDWRMKTMEKQSISVSGTEYEAWGVKSGKVDSCR